MGSLFKRDSQDRFLADLAKVALGRSVHFSRMEPFWRLWLEDEAFFQIETSWRLLDAERICVCSADDGQQFGLPAPVDAEAAANKLLSGTTPIAAEFISPPGDLSLLMSNDLTLQLLTTSMGYESWTLWIDGEHSWVGGNGGLCV